MSSTEASCLKPHSTPLTLEWLQQNYELGEGVCIPRSTLYVHYLDFCEKMHFAPVNAASFGKIIRQQFPQITTRRLGTRGQSKYHYYGIAVQESSAYFEPGFAKSSVTSSSESGHDLKQNWVFSPRSKIGTRLPPLPNINDLAVNDDVEREKLVTFRMMYQTHCQRILDIVIRANFDEIETYLLHFWRGLPDHILGLLNSPLVGRLIAFCDLQLYRTIVSVILPEPRQSVTESFVQSLKTFAASIIQWLEAALERSPVALQTTKLRYAKFFANHLRRQLAQILLSASARVSLQSSELISQLMDDLAPLDLEAVCRQTAALTTCKESAFNCMMSVFQDLENVLEEQLPLEDFCKWMNEVIDQATTDIQLRSGCSRWEALRELLQLWCFFNSRVLQELLLLGAETYGSCQLLSLFLEQHATNQIEARLLDLEADTLLHQLTRPSTCVPPASEIQTDAFF